MKRLSSIICHLVLSVALLLLLASCSKNQGGRLIPDSAIAVFRLDVMKTMESTGMKGDDTSLKSQIEKLIKNAGIDKEVREKLLDIIDDPTSSGIDFTEPVYLYLATKGNNGFDGGFVGTTASKGDLEDVIKMLGEMDDDITLEEYKSDGIQYARIERGTAIIFNSDWFYIGPVDEYGDWDSAVEDIIEELLDRAAGNNNIEDNKVFQQMCDCKGLLQIGIFGSGLENIPNANELIEQLPEDCDLKDIGGVTDVAINKGEIVLEGKAVLLSDAWKEQIDRFNMNPIEKSQAKYADANGALAIVNADTKGLFDYIKKIVKNSGASDSDMEKFNELKPIFDAFTGQAMIALNSWEENGNPEVVAYVGTKDNSIVETLLNAGNDENIEKVGTDEYRIPIDYDYDYNDSIGDWTMTPTKYIHAGWKNNQTYFLMNTDGEPFATPRKSFTDVKGVGLFAYVSGELLGQVISSINYDAEVVGRSIADLLDYMELYYDSATKGIFRIAMKEKDKSPVVTIIDYVKKKFM